MKKEAPKKRGRKPVTDAPKKTLAEVRKERRRSKDGSPEVISDEISDRICSILRLGGYVEQASAQVGIDKFTVYLWMKKGAREIKRRQKYREEIAQEIDDDQYRQRAIRTEERARRKLRDQEHTKKSKEGEPYVRFSIAIEKAMAEGENAMLGIISKAAAGGAVTKRTTRAMSDGTTVTSESHASPDWRAAAWRLEKRFPRRWGSQHVEMNVEADVKIDDRIAKDRLIAAFARMAGSQNESQERSEDEDDDSE